MDLAVFIILLVIVICFFRKFSNVVYFICISDILLRIITFIKLEVTSGQVYAFINKYIPASVPAIISGYSSGILEKVLIWAYVVVFCIFEFYLLRIFFRKSK